MKSYNVLIDKYSRYATYYDRRWNRSFGDGILQAVLETVPWSGLGQVLDVGCGTGLLEEAVRNRVRQPVHFVGVDISLAMLQKAQQKLHHSSRFRWTTAQAENLPFPSATFDAVVCANSFHYYRQPVRVLEEIRRVLQPDGWLVLADWCNDFLVNKLGQLALRLAHSTYIHRYAMKRCYGMRQMEAMLASAGFHVDWGQKEAMDWGWGIMIYRARAG
ncbi:MAG: class I SAM-dependent methyltransferase [Acidobacteria bacterium]|nr:class I SAM-dependent methyltransferase [Acidobacteriota bacterium]